MRRGLATFVAVGLLVACSGDPESTPDATATETSLVADDPDGDTSIETAPPDTEAPPSVSPDAPSGAAIVDRAVQEFGDESPEAVLALWAALTGPLPSLPDPVQPDPYPDLTHALEDLEQVRDRLDPADLEVIDQRIDELLTADFEFTLVADDVPAANDGAAAPEDTEGHRGPMGLVLPESPPAPGDPLSDADFRDDDRDVWITAARSVLTRLQARLPRADGMVVKVIVTSPSFWVRIAERGGDTSEPGGGTLVNRGPGSIRETLQGRYDPDGEADCYLLTARDGRRPPGAAQAQSMLAHELFHCWHYVSVGRDTDRYDNADDWVREGLAAWVGETIAGGSDYSGNWLSRFVANPFDLYASAYAAYGFWGRITEGSDLWALIPALIERSATNSDAVHGLAIDAIRGDSAFVASGALQRDSLGPEWTTESWMPPRHARAPAEGSAGPDDPADRSIDAGAQRADRISTTAAAGSIITVEATGLVAIAEESSPDELIAAFDDDIVLDLCVVECVCPGTDEPLPADATLDVEDPVFVAAMSGRVTQGSRLSISVAPPEEDSEDCESEVPPLSTETGVGGLIGTWLADSDSVAQTFAQASGFDAAGAGLDIAGVTGAVRLVFDEDGSGTLSYNSVTLFINDQVLGDVTLDGGGTFAWTIAGGDVVIDGIEYAVTVGSSAVGGEILTITSADISATGTTTLSGGVAGNQLVFTSADGSRGEVFFPILWNRVD